ncbi:MAG: polymerase subunit sigma-24 [Polyangiaceae bacterium]|jgi:RNA polymerase sigma-70 factor (ECF subfamily)|nr:polymerase subunit sigma-24 [Polyangiaceae bacterium]
MTCYSPGVTLLATDTPAELVAKAGAGERAAEEALCQRFAPAVRAFARRRLRGIDAIEEFTQDVLLLLVEAVRGGRVEQGDRVGGFVLGICRNLAFDRARQRERREALWQTYGVVLQTVSVPAVESEPYEIAHLEDCVSQLSRRAREVVRLGFVEARDHEEVAAALDITPQNARVMRHRTLASLRECMAKRMSWEAA